MLSARERQIIASIEQQFVLENPYWVLRFDRLAKTAATRARRRLEYLAGTLASLDLACADVAHGRGPWLWAVLASSAGAFGLYALRAGMRRRARKAETEVERGQHSG